MQTEWMMKIHQKDEAIDKVSHQLDLNYCKQQSI